MINKKLYVTWFIKALGISSSEDIINYFGNDERLQNTLNKDDSENQEQALIKIYDKLKPSEPATPESAKNLIDQYFFDPKKYDLSKVGRYKFNKNYH